MYASLISFDKAQFFIWAKVIIERFRVVLNFSIDDTPSIVIKGELSVPGLFNHFSVWVIRCEGGSDEKPLICSEFIMDGEGVLLCGHHDIDVTFIY